MHCMQIGLYDTQDQQPSVKYVHMSGSSTGPPTPLDLEEAVPLSHLLAPIGSCKECITAAIDSLQADSTTGINLAQLDGNLGSRSFGPALQAVLRSVHAV